MEPIPDPQDSPTGFELASVRSRAVARLIDLIIIGVPAVYLFFTLLALNVFEAESGMGLLTFPAVWAVYEVALIAVRGQTVGKKSVGIKVVTTRNEPPGWKSAAIRWAVTAGELISLFGFVLYLIPSRDKKRQGLHDKLAKTFVVYAVPPARLERATRGK
jgi:uncharacterized RDD family membrane protein YckC